MPFVKGKAKTGGRKKGQTNKLTADLKGAILGALDDVGGQRYLRRVANEQPQVFCSLLGKVLPTTMATDPKNPLFPSRIEVKLVSPKS